jgi:hypothetical protein
MNEFKLFMVYHLGKNPCWNLRVARSPEEALTNCLDYPDRERPGEKIEKSCRVEEVQLKGYKIHVEPE